MRNNRHLLRGLLMAACALGFPAGAAAQYEADESDPLITTVSPTGDTQLTSNCTWKPEKGTDNYLPENNEALYDAGNYLGTLIDGSQATYWHSEPTTMDYRTTLEYIQADLRRDDLQRVYLFFDRRQDPYNGALRPGVMPSTIDIYATNTPDDESSWKKVQTISGIPDTQTEAAWPYTSPLIDFGGAAYRYVRVVPTAGTYGYWCPAEMQFYPARKIEDNRVVLQNVADSIEALGLDFRTGTTAGYVSREDSANYTDTFGEILDILDDEAATQGQLADAAARLRKLVADTYAAIIPVTSGYYFVESGYAPFEEIQGVRKALCEQDGNANLQWATLDEGSPGFYIGVNRLESGEVTMQFLYDGRYVGWNEGDARYTVVYTPLTSSPARLTLVPTGRGTFYITGNLPLDCYLHAIGHKDGAGESGTVMPASGYDERELWEFVPADTTRLAEASGKANLRKLADTADSLYNSLFVPGKEKGLIQEVNTRADGTNQLWSNCTWAGIDKSNDNYQYNADFINDGYNLLGALTDGDDQTYWHSSTTFDVNAQQGYLQADLRRGDLSSYVLMLDRRNDIYQGAFRHGIMPRTAEIYATNDETIGTDVNSATDAWNKIGTITGIPSENDDGVWPFYSDTIKADTAYRFLRVALSNASQPYICFSGFNVYVPGDYYSESLSPYYTVAGLKDAADKMKSLADAARADAPGADEEGLRSAIEAVGSIAEEARAAADTSAREFPILAWYSVIGDGFVRHNRYEELADAGFNISFSHFATMNDVEQALRASAGTGVKIMAMAGTSITDNTAGFVSRFKDDRNLYGWFLGDEPTASGIASVANTAKAIRAIDSTHVIYGNLLPIWVNTDVLGAPYKDYMEKYLRETGAGLLSYDNYPVYTYNSNVYLRSDFFSNLETAHAVADEFNVPFWAFALATGHDPYPTAETSYMRLEVFCALAYGAQGIQYFTYWTPVGTIWNFHDAPLSADGERSDVYYRVKEVNSEIRNLTRVFLGAKVEKVGYTGTLPVSGTSAFGTLPKPFRTISSTGGDGLLISQFKNGGAEYLMVVNRDINNTQRVTVAKTQALTRILPTGEETLDNSLSSTTYSLETGQYLIWRISDEATGVGIVAAARGFSARGSQGCITVDSGGRYAEVYSDDGAYYGRTNGRLSVPKGIYVVRCGKQSVKVSVR